MILRLAAALSAVFGVTLFLLYLHMVGKGPWADEASRHLRAMKDRTAVPAALEPITIGHLAELPAGLPLGHYAELEKEGVRIEGHVQLMVRAADGDFHLELVASADPPRDALVPYVTAEITPQWRRGSQDLSYEQLLAVFRPRHGGPARWAASPRRVRLAGWLLYDYPFEGETPKPGKPPRLSRWEIHPVTSIEYWDDSLSAFVEYPS